MKFSPSSRVLVSFALVVAAVPAAAASGQGPDASTSLRVPFLEGVPNPVLLMIAGTLVVGLVLGRRMGFVRRKSII